MQATLGGRELIQLAINREKASFALYSRAAVQADSEKVKKVFNRIARDELVHLFTLLSRFERVYLNCVNRGRNLIFVDWDNGLSMFVFPSEIEIIGGDLLLWQ